MHHPRRLLFLLAAALALIILAQGHGCVPMSIGSQQITAQDVAATQQVLADTRAELEATQARLVALQAGQPPDAEPDPEIAAIEQRIGELAANMEKLEAAAATWAEIMAANPDMDRFGQLLAGAQAAAPLIPPPWGELILGGVSILAIIRAAANRRAGRQVAASVAAPMAAALAADPTLGATIRAAQGTAAGRLVDEAQGRALALPL